MSTTAISNPVLETNLARLSRYGYRRAPITEPVPPETEWARLKGDFAEPGRAIVPDFDALPPDTQTAAERYLSLKREADRLLSACEAAHDEILRRGLDVARVEDYVRVRDAYEDKIEEFGAARDDVSAYLRQE